MTDTPSHARLLNLLEHNNIYALIDGSCHNDVAGYAAEREEAGAAGALVDLAAYPQVTPNAVPHVVALSPRVAGFVTRDVWQVGEDAEPPAWGVLFEAREAAAFADLLAHWRALYHVTAPLVVQGDAVPTKMIFRFWDARLIGAFLGVSTPEERAAFFGPVARLFLPQADGTTITLDAPDKAVMPVLVSDAEPFAMRAEHMTALEVRRLELRLPAFRAYLEKHFEAGLAFHAGKDRDEFIKAELKRAGDHGFLSERAAVGWLSLAVLHGPDFDTSTPWARTILEEPERTIGSTDRQDRLIAAGFDAARPSERKG